MAPNFWMKQLKNNYEHLTPTLYIVINMPEPTINWILVGQFLILENIDCLHSQNYKTIRSLSTYYKTL